LVSEEIKNAFIKYLKENKHRITNERFLILDAAINMEGHFDADELYLKMRKDLMRVSRATVYNTLELMCDCKILTKHNFKDDRARYETKYGRSNHYHILCVSCKVMLEFENDEIEKLLTKTCKKYDLKLLDHSLQVFATCNGKGKCLNRKTSGKKEKK
jgi:Fur family transcriptional regulator, ferric uptake regulator